MKFNKKQTKSIILISAIIVSTILQVAYLSFYNGNTNETNQNLNSDMIKNDMPKNPPIHTSSNSPPNADYFKFYKIITIDPAKVSGTGNHYDFPVLISILDADLHDIDKVQSDGDDIAFSNGTHWLDHEIEGFNQNYNPTYAKLIAWVRIPQLSKTTGTEIYMYYGNSTIGPQENPSGVWKNNYVGVWHLNEMSGNALDSTSYGRVGVPYGGVTQGVTGQIDGSYGFDGVNDQVSCGDPSDGHLDFGTNSFTISFWINIDGSTSDYQLPIYKGATTTSDKGYDFETNQDGFYLCFGISDGDEVVRTDSIEGNYFDTWMYVTGLVDRGANRIRLYKNDLIIDGGTSISTVGSIDNINAFMISPSAYSIDGMIDEVRVSNISRSFDWIKTEYYNQYNTSSFYSVGPEMAIVSNIQVNAIDLYGRPIPSVNISIINNTEILQSEIAELDGSVTFTNFPRAYYNFSVTITSNIPPYQIETINKTSEAIYIDASFCNISLICNISRNIFYIEDIDGNPLESGWIEVRHNMLYGSQDLQNCTINTTGKATFRWLNTSGYHYTVWYQDNNYNPNKIVLASGEIPSVDSQIDLTVNLTTVDLNVFANDGITPISGAKLLISNTSSLESVINLTTDLYGEVTFRWLNTSNFYNYSLRIKFFGLDWEFDMIGVSQSDPKEAEFSIEAATAYNIEIQIQQSELEEYETAIESLNPKDSIVIDWGINLTLRVLFNVTQVPTGYESLLGPEDADSMSYEIYFESTLVKSGSMTKENDYIGRYQCIIGTYGLETELLYTIKIKGYKTEYVVPTDLQLSLYLLKNDLKLNQSENDDSLQSVYWSETPDMSVKSYGEISEEMIIEDEILYNIDGSNYDFQFSIPDLSIIWNLSRITFNIYNISWNVAMPDINITFIDPSNNFWMWHENNATLLGSQYNYVQGWWKGITLDLDIRSPIGDNLFNFTIGGSFVGTVQINAEAIFRRHQINAEYYKSNITDVISIPAHRDNGLVMKNITFEIINCHYLAGGLVDPVTVLDNITTNEGYLVSYIYEHGNGYGKLTMNDIIIYPLDGIFLFNIGNNSDIIFDVRIRIEYIQEFYKNNYLEFVSYSKTVNTSGDFSICLTEEELNEQGAILYINNLKNLGSNPIYPSEAGMNITILDQIVNIPDKLKSGNGEFMLDNIMGFTKNKIFFAIIRANQSVTFTLSFMITYSRTVVYEIEGTVTYEIEGTNIGDMVQYDQNLGLYSQNINTSLIFARYEPYTIKFTVAKDNYNSAVKELNLKVLERLTLISGSSTNLDFYPIIYIQDELPFNFSYTDEQYFTNIIDLETQSYTMTKISAGGQSVLYGSGDLYINSDNEYVLDINTEALPVGRYTIWVTLDKQNYQSKQAIIFLTVNEREIDYDLGKMFKDKQVNVVKGKTVLLSIELTDPTKGDSPLTDAEVILEIGDDEFEFDEVEDGIYELEFETGEYEAFFTSNTITGTIKISKVNYTSEDVDITIVIEMEEIEIMPGTFSMPIFYLMILIIAIVAVSGSLAAYRYIQLAKIPEFVKKTRLIKKLIKNDNEIDNSLLYPSKESYMAYFAKDNWDVIGIPLETILGIKIQKVEELVKTKPKLITTERANDLIPKGLILMRWDERVGTEIVVKYPESIDISKKTLMQIYGTHEYTAESGIVNLMAGNSNILSYYTGVEKGYYLVLILNLDDDPDLYEDALPDILRIIMQNLEGDAYVQLIPTLFQRLSMFPNLTAEGKLAYIYQDEIKRMIINRLREEGEITKSELTVWLKDKYKEGFFDLENILAELIKMEIIKGSSIKGFPSELIFLINDIFMIRVPSIELTKNPEAHGLPSQLTKNYIDEIGKFFKTYRPSEEDNINLVETINDPQVYETLRLLRTAIITRNDLEKLKKKGVTDINTVLKQLWQAKMITVLQDKTGNEYYALLSDLKSELIFPKYLIQIIKNGYDQKSKGDNVLIEYLNILEDTYLTLKSREKS